MAEIKREILSEGIPGDPIVNGFGQSLVATGRTLVGSGATIQKTHLLLHVRACHNCIEHQPMLEQRLQFDSNLENTHNSSYQKRLWQVSWYS